MELNEPINHLGVHSVCLSVVLNKLLFVHILPSCTCYWVMKDFVVKDPCIRKRRTFDSAMPHSLLIEILADKNLEYGECQKS